MILKPTKTRIAVVLEDTKNGRLSETVSDGGIVIKASDMSIGYNTEDGLKDRWASVIATGPGVVGVRVGDRILIANGKWTECVSYDGNNFWFTETEHVLLIDDQFFDTDGKEKTIAHVMLNLQ